MDLRSNANVFDHDLRFRNAVVGNSPGEPAHYGKLRQSDCFQSACCGSHNPGTNGGGGTSPGGQTFTVSVNANFCPAASQAAQSAVAIAEERLLSVSMDVLSAYTGRQGAHSQIFLRDTCEGAAEDCKPQTTVLSSAQDNTKATATAMRLRSLPMGATSRSAPRDKSCGDTPGGKQIFLRDTCNGGDSSCKPQTQLISLDPDGRLSGTDNLLPSISSSGRYNRVPVGHSLQIVNASQANSSQINTGIARFCARYLHRREPVRARPKQRDLHRSRVTQLHYRKPLAPR